MVGGFKGLGPGPRGHLLGTGHLLGVLLEGAKVLGGWLGNSLKATPASTTSTATPTARELLPEPAEGQRDLAHHQLELLRRKREKRS